MSQRLLVVEDSPTQLLSIQSTLQGAGYTVLGAHTAAEGLARAYSEIPDLIISDVLMSGINGYQLCRLIKNDPDLSSIPVILLTKLDGSIDRFWGMKSGADRYIPKDAGFTDLLSAVKDLLGKNSPHSSLRVLQEAPQPEEINSRLHQLLERLLFEATVIDEVRQIGDDISDLDIIAEQLFDLLESIITSRCSALVVNHGHYSLLKYRASGNGQDKDIRAYAARLALQLGLPPLNEESSRAHRPIDNAITQPIDVRGQRLGLLVVIPPPERNFKPGDQKVVRLICEQLSIILRLYLSLNQPETGVMAKP